MFRHRAAPEPEDLEQESELDFIPFSSGLLDRFAFGQEDIP